MKYYKALHLDTMDFSKSYVHFNLPKIVAEIEELKNKY
jgi:hypothetical protein